ncbi:ferrous iron transport protein B [Olegusella massiliensis]|uniref:ferrous iron transport protein B n=1 Tax=Olegusella massiliensis TaxID=1776381 RepID=UPI0008385398|nr:ferrous iron transport protein B [Olegusella massiliensis]MBS5864879.1 ferrous iron transport protein B [Coriobacteriaceae bacterium]
MADKTYIALAGNPNCGKTTLFNELTGSNGYVGNWPGVTVEKKQAPWLADRKIEFVDLPGIYSLSPYSPEETVSRDYLLDSRPNATINLVDVTNLERNLYLTTQVLETGCPVVVGLNMCDLLKERGDVIDTKALSEKLGVPVLEVSALHNQGLDELVKTAVSAGKAGKAATGVKCFPADVEDALSKIAARITGKCAANLVRWYAIKIFERDAVAVDSLKLSQAMLAELDAIISTVEAERDDAAEDIIASERYEWIAGVMDACVKKAPKKLTRSQKIDKIITNRFLGLPIFMLVMIGVYWIAISTVGTGATDWVNDNLFSDGWELFGMAMPSIPAVVTGWLEAAGASALVTSLAVDGVVTGVGAILGFVPQMTVLFVLLCFLEDCGYMSRVAFVMDRAFRRFGLSGKSFIPILISSGCGVPGVLSTKTIENERDRRMTAMVTTFIPCSAKLPIIALLMGALIGGVKAWWIAPFFYFLGVLAVIVSAIMLKKTKPFLGEPAPFVMELPDYHFPSIKSWFLHVWERVKSFIVKAGTIIFASTVVVWFLSNFGFAGWEGGSGAFGYLPGMEGAPDEFIDYSVLATFSGLIAWIFTPLGFVSWKATAMSVMGLVAKENIVSTFATLSSLGDAGETDPSMWVAFGQMFAANGVVNTGAMLGFVAFNMLCAPCFAAMGTIKRQMDDIKWFWAAIGYECLFGWVVGMIINQLYGLIVYGSFGFWTLVAFVLLAAMLFQLFRPVPTHEHKDNKILTKLSEQSQ